MAKLSVNIAIKGLTIGLLGIAACPVTGQTTFLRLHPDNPHYFQWQGKPTVLITSGEHYGAVLNLEFDYRKYLDTLAADSLNLTRTFSGVYCEDPAAFNITDNTLAPKEGQLICPWQRSDKPGYGGGGNRFELTKWNDDYFSRLEDFITHAKRRGVVVEFVLFCPMYRDSMWDLSPMKASNNVNDIGDVPREEVYTLKHPDLLAVHLAFTRKVVHELRAFDNLYYEVCNEPYFGGVTMDWQHKIVDCIVEAERDFPEKHLISLNIANGRQQVTSPHPAVSIFNFHYCVPPDTVAINYGLKKIIGENETGFRGSDDLLYRTEGWDFMLAGGALYNNLDYSFSAKHPAGTFSGYTSPGGGSPALRKQLAILKRFVESTDFLRMQPQSDFVTSVKPDLTTTFMAQPDKQYVGYLHIPLPNRPKKISDHLREGITAQLKLSLPAGTYQIHWWNTLTGDVTTMSAIKHDGGTLDLTSPAFDNDIAVKISVEE